MTEPTTEAAPFLPCIVVPYFCHEHAIAGLIERLRPQGLPCWIVDDGNPPEALAVIETLLAREPHWLRVVHLSPNQGKGAAVRAGCLAAAAAGYSHFVQIDADGQHDCADLPRFIDVARAAPDAVVTGVPVYDESVPRVRLYGRYLTHALVWLHTLSFEITDSMCGFRVYPIAATLALWLNEPIGRRMDFDTDILVRLHWRGVRVISLPTRVTYPEDGVSHFDYLGDNLRMASLHVRLFAGMLWRLPAWIVSGRRADRTAA